MVQEKTDLLEEIDFNKISELPSPSNETLDKVDKVISETKSLSKEEYQTWKLFKKARQQINRNLEKGVFPKDETICWITLESIQKNGGLPQECKALCIIYS